MGSETEVVEQRLKSFLAQLRTEFGILHRIVYKNKNQHRRSPYLQFLLKILLDVVCKYNAVSSLAQKKQAIKISEGGVEAFREYYPLKDQPSVFLECVWRTDKYVLVEKINGSETQSQGKDIGEDVPSGVSAVHYQSIEVVLGDAEPEMEAPNCDPEGPDYRNNDSGSLAGPLLQCEEEKQVKGRSPASESPPNCSNTAPEGSSLETSSLSLNPNRLKSKRELKEKVAFVSVKAPAPSRANKLDPSIKGTAEKKEDEADTFFGMLTSGYMKRE